MAEKLKLRKENFMFFFTADEHYGHRNIIKYCNRPFNSVLEMDQEIIKRHNAVVKSTDTVIHAGDFSLSQKSVAQKYVAQLNGSHIFLQGSHDRWLNDNGKIHEVWEKNVEGHFIVVCHYAMRVWARSHYGSWMLYGHSHGKLPPVGKQHDIGVDNNDFYPVSFLQIKKIMETRPENPNQLKI
jgi:calcineurin-like phosphoesterase family protein